MFKKPDKLKSEDITCPKCNKIISRDVVKEAEEKSRKKIEESIKKFGTMNVNMKWEIVCDHCGNKIIY
ncbi:MAG: DUF2225 domain-containing protein [Spirochaetes bacterium]|nr:DUF2225 domain-containing protein [Spirochaetota bacterium]